MSARVPLKMALLMGKVSAEDADGVIDEYRAEVRREDAARLLTERRRHVNRAIFCDGITYCAGLLERWAGEGVEEATAAAATATPELTVYRASHDSIVMGLYTTREAAQHHCEASAYDSDSVYRSAVFAWHKDEEDGVVELFATLAPSSMPEGPTGYVVTPLEVASEYDEEADE